VVLVLNLSKKFHGSMDGTTGIGFFLKKTSYQAGPWYPGPTLDLGIRVQG
jgi:hypothetical protein